MVSYYKILSLVGTVLNVSQLNHILFMRPSRGISGLSPKDFYKVIGKVVKTNISKNTPIKLDRLYD